MENDSLERQEPETPKGSTEVEASPKPSIDDVVSTRMQEAEEKVTDNTSDVNTTEKLIDKKPETKGERIQRLYREEKQRNEALSGQVATLQSEIQRINERLEAGTINPQQAIKEKQEAVQEAIELNEDLKPYEKDLTMLFNRQLEPFKRQIEALLSERNQRYEAETSEKIKQVEQKATDLYSKQAELNPHLFLPKNDKGEIELKPELDKLATEIFNKYNRPMLDSKGHPVKDDKGNPIIYNTLFDPDNLEESLEMLFSRLNREFDKAERAKADNEKVVRIKNGRVETPVSRNGVSRKLTVEDIVEKHMKQFAT